MNQNQCRWNVLPPAPAQFIKESGFSPLMAQLLYNRGLHEPAQIELFLTSDERLSSDPFLMPGMEQAVARVYRALLSGEKIAVYGDFDVDGITGTTLLVKGLSALGAKTIPYIPHRVTEGHGLRRAALEELSQQGVSLVVTVDCGITDVAECDWARKAGLDVLITDHHTPPSSLPAAAAIIDSKLSDYPHPELAGVGVGYKLLQALFKTLGRVEIMDGLIDLVAIGTVADMMPLISENRYLVTRGLKALNTAPRLGIREMMAQCNLSIGSLDTEKVTWCLAPWLNASGRLEHAMSSYKLLETDSPEEARELATALGQKNTERQQLDRKLRDEIREKIAAQGLTPLLMFASPDYPLGVAGPVAGKISDEFYRPVIIVRVDENTSSGSCRSIPEFNIIAALNQCGNLLGHFGGHAQAAGFSIPNENLSRLQECLSGIADTQLAGVDLRPRLDIDTEIALPELAGSTYKTIQRLAPFGKGNPFPVFLARGVQVLSCRAMGNGGDHLKLKVKQQGTIWDGVAFGFGNCLKDVVNPLDIVFNLEIDQWQGRESLRLNIISFKPSGQKG